MAVHLTLAALATRVNPAVSVLCPTTHGGYGLFEPSVLVPETRDSMHARM